MNAYASEPSAGLPEFPLVLASGMIMFSFLFLGVGNGMERYSVTCKGVTQGASGGESSHGCFAAEALKCCFVSAPRGFLIAPVGLDILAKVRIAYVRAECGVVRHHVLHW